MKYYLKDPDLELDKLTKSKQPLFVCVDLLVSWIKSLFKREKEKFVYGICFEKQIEGDECPHNENGKCLSQWCFYNE